MLGIEWMGYSIGSKPVHHIRLLFFLNLMVLFLNVKLRMVSWIISALPRTFFAFPCYRFSSNSCLLIVFVFKNMLVERQTKSAMYLGRVVPGRLYFGLCGWAAGYYTWRVQMLEGRGLCSRVCLFFLVYQIWFSTKTARISVFRVGAAVQLCHDSYLQLILVFSLFFTLALFGISLLCAPLRFCPASLLPSGWELLLLHILSCSILWFVLLACSFLPAVRNCWNLVFAVPFSICVLELWFILLFFPRLFQGLGKYKRYRSSGHLFEPEVNSSIS